MPKNDTQNTQTGDANLVTAHAVAAALHQNVETIRRWAREARIPCERVWGRGLLFDLEAVKAVVLGWEERP